MVKINKFRKESNNISPESTCDKDMLKKHREGVKHSKKSSAEEPLPPCSQHQWESLSYLLVMLFNQRSKQLSMTQ